MASGRTLSTSQLAPVIVGALALKRCAPALDLAPHWLPSVLVPGPQSCVKYALSGAALWGAGPDVWRRLWPLLGRHEWFECPAQRLHKSGPAAAAAPTPIALAQQLRQV